MCKSALWKYPQVPVLLSFLPHVDAVLLIELSQSMLGWWCHWTEELSQFVEQYLFSWACKKLSLDDKMQNVTAWQLLLETTSSVTPRICYPCWNMSDRQGSKMHTCMIHSVLFSAAGRITKGVYAGVSKALHLSLFIVRRHARVFKIKWGLDRLWTASSLSR